MAEIRTQEGIEVWETTTAGGVWFVTVDARGIEKDKRIKGPSGYRFKISTLDREHNHGIYVDPKDDIFLNGTFKRVDVGVADMPEEYQTDQALSDADLADLLLKSGNAFHSAVKKLTERNARRVLEMVTAENTTASVAQSSFVAQWVDSTYHIGPVVEEAAQD